MPSHLDRRAVAALAGERLARDADRRALLDELLSRAVPDDSSFAGRAGTFGLEPGRTEVVVCMKVLQAEGEVDGPSATHWAANAFALASGPCASRAFVVARVDDVVAVLEAVGPHNARTVVAEVASAAERRKVAIQAAIGNPFTNLSGVLDSYNSAMRALRHTRRARPIVWSPSDITLFDELVLSYAGDGQRLIPTKTRRALSDPTVRSTLEALFEANFNVAVAAEALFLHPNSLRYRLAAITRSTGRDPRKPSDLFELCAAARVLDAGSVNDGRQ